MNPTIFVKNLIFMAVDFVDELKWRGMIHDAMPGVEEHLNEKMRLAYVGIDPTADSLHIGHLVSVMMLKHFQRAGHKPVALLGGATGMIGDPSGKSQERNLLDEATLRHNQNAIQSQLSKFLDFDTQDSRQALLVNNYDWMSEFSFLEFIRDVGKHITVNYMMAKDSVKKRISGDEGEGMSFTEFSYQLVQGYDFLHLFQENGCTIQMGGSDQWGNITTGTEMIRRIAGGKAFAITCPLITKADGTKFGKTEGGNVWLDPEKTSPYKFYQYWLNTSDEDAEKYIKIFTLLTNREISDLILEHQEAPHLRKLQNRLADEITVMVHSSAALDTAKKASKILFGKSTNEDIKSLSESEVLAIFEGIPQAKITRSMLEEGIGIINGLSAETGFLSSNGEARRELKGNAIAVNKDKVKEDYTLSTVDLIADRFILLSKGKKNNYLIIVEG
jgi:tyrosyl-tRNA synthetase